MIKRTVTKMKERDLTALCGSPQFVHLECLTARHAWAQRTPHERCSHLGPYLHGGKSPQ